MGEGGARETKAARLWYGVGQHPIVQHGPFISAPMLWFTSSPLFFFTGECISGFRPVVDPFNYIGQGKQVIIPSLKFNDSGHITAFHLAGTCNGGSGKPGVGPADYKNRTQDCINILQVWRASGGDGFSIAANFTATLAVPVAEGVTTSVTVDTPVPFSSGDVLGFTPGPDTPGFYFQVANTPNQQSASHMYYTYDSFVTEVSTAGGGNRVSSSPIISVEGERISYEVFTLYIECVFGYES